MVHEIPADIFDKAHALREVMLDSLTLFDDVLAEKFLLGEEISIEEINRAMRK